MAHGENYPDDWNTRNLRSKAVKFVEELQAMSDKAGLYITTTSLDAGGYIIVDAEGQAVVTELRTKGNKYFGCYQELIGERPESDEEEED